MQTYTRQQIEQTYGPNAVLLGIAQVFVPGAGWTDRAMDGSYCAAGKAMLTPTNGGIFVAFMDGATKVQFCVSCNGGFYYPDYAIAELAEQFN